MHLRETIGSVSDTPPRSLGVLQHAGPPRQSEKHHGNLYPSERRLRGTVPPLGKAPISEVIERASRGAEPKSTHPEIDIIRDTGGVSAFKNKAAS